MKRIFQKAIGSIMGVLICISLSGCTVGGYNICDFYTDESGNHHFALVGKHGASGDVEEIENESSETADDIQENDHDSNSIVGDIIY